MPLIREHSELTADDVLMRQLRDKLLQQAAAVCFRGDASTTDLFRSQLSTIIDDALPQYIGSKVDGVREELIFDICDILFDQLTFFHFMYDTDNLAV